MFSLIFKISWNLGVVCWFGSAALACLVGVSFSDGSQQPNSVAQLRDPQLHGPDSVTPTPWPRLRGPGSVAPAPWPPLCGGVPSFAGTNTPAFESTGRVAHAKLYFSLQLLP